MASIYELTSAYRQIEDALLLDCDDEELFDLFCQIDDAVEVKAENYGKLIRNTEADIDAIDKEIARLQGMKATRANLIKRLKDNLMESMRLTGKTNFKTKLFSFGIAKNGGLAPLKLDVEPKDLPAELQKVTVAADASAIRKYIEETGDLSYAHFEERGEHLNMR